MKKNGLVVLIMVLAAVGALFFFGQNSGQRTRIIREALGDGGPSRVWAIRAPAGAARALPDPAGRRLASLAPNRQFLQLWEGDGLPGARPLELRRSGSWFVPVFAFHPSGGWCVATLRAHRGLDFLATRAPLPQRRRSLPVSARPKALAFSPDSRWLATGWEDGVRLLPVGGGVPSEVREIRLPVRRSAVDIRFDPESRFLLVASSVDAWVVPLDGGPCRQVVPPTQLRQLSSENALRYIAADR